MLLISIVVVVSIAITFLLIGNYYKLSETESLLAQLKFRTTRISLVTESTEPTQYSTLTPIPSLTSTATLTATPTPEINEQSAITITPQSGQDFSRAYITHVVHIQENGRETMVRIFAPEVVEGEFFAEVTIAWNTWDYYCIILEGIIDHLFCIGGRLPATNSARIEVFEVINAEIETILVFNSEFRVPIFLPSPTNTPGSKPKATSAPSLTPTPTRTNTPSPTFTPSRTPHPTATFTPSITVPPWASATPSS